MRDGAVALRIVSVALRRDRRAARGQAPQVVVGEVAGLAELGDLGDVAGR